MSEKDEVLIADIDEVDEHQFNRFKNRLDYFFEKLDKVIDKIIKIWIP